MEVEIRTEMISCLKKFIFFWRQISTTSEWEIRISRSLCSWGRNLASHLFQVSFSVFSFSLVFQYYIIYILTRLGCCIPNTLKSPSARLWHPMDKNQEKSVIFSQRLKLLKFLWGSTERKIALLRDLLTLLLQLSSNSFIILFFHF